MKYKENGQFKPIYVKALDSMPVGTKVDFDGQASDIPVGWEQVEDKGEVYSTTEQRIGTWVDNRPIYQKTLIIDGSSLSTGYNSINHNIDNLDIVVQENVTCYRSDNIRIQLPLVPADKDSLVFWGIFQHDFSSTTANIYIGTSYSGNNAHVTKLYITIKYTKTTDQGGNA